MVTKPRGIADQLTLSLPGLLMFLALLVMAAPSFAGMRYAPQIWVVALFFWRIYSPQVAPYWAVFLAGLTYDVLSGAPLGAHAVSALAAVFILEKFARRLVRQPFRILWLSAAAFTCVLLIMSAVTAKIAGGEVMMGWLMGAWIATSFSYPLWHGLFAFVLRALPAGTLRG